jgi:hypothetical protein
MTSNTGAGVSRASDAEKRGTTLGGDDTVERQKPARVVRRLTTPRAAAVSGILFALLMGATMHLVRIEASGDNVRDASWLAQNETGVGLGLLLLPLAGIAFLWFMGVVRHNFGEYEDQFYGTVFIGSGLLFLAMLFVGGATTGAVLSAYTRDPSFVTTDGYRFGTDVALELFRVYSLRMAGVFLLSLGTMWWRSGLMPRWLAIAQVVVGVFMLTVVGSIGFAFLAFPLWVGAVSVYMLFAAYRVDHLAED